MANHHTGNLAKVMNTLQAGDRVQVSEEVHCHIPACANCGRISRFTSGGYAVVKLDSGDTLRVRPEDLFLIN